MAPTPYGALAARRRGWRTTRERQRGRSQFIYNWATPQTAGVCYALTMTTADGTPTKALFKLK